MKLRELPNWPPSPSGLNLGSRNKAPKPDQVVLKSVDPRRRRNRVVFTGEFEGNPHNYDYEAEHPRLAEHIETVLRKHIGKSVMHLGDIEIDGDALTCEPSLSRKVRANVPKGKPPASKPRPAEEGELGTERSSN